MGASSHHALNLRYSFMKRPLFALWLTLPVAAYAYHMGPGQEHMRLDQVAVLIESADFHVAEAERIAALNGDEAAVEDWTRAEADYAEALDLLPDERVTEARRLKLERAKAQMFISKLPVANATLSGMVTELLDVPDVDPELLADVQRTFATSQYYMTWLQRLEGAPREEWEPRIDSARQIFKLLATKAEAEDNKETTKEAREDLESAIRLARMDLSELQGLPLPSQ
jgi:hypothetical protein